MFRFSLVTMALLGSPAFSGEVIRSDMQADGATAEDICCASSTPRDVKIPDSIPNHALKRITTNRTLIFQAGGDPGCNEQSIRVIFKGLAPPYDLWNGEQLWVGAPKLTSEAASLTIPSPEFWSNYWAKLQCAPECRSDWGALGDIHVYHEGVVPDSEYEIQIVDCQDPMCLDNEEAYSEPLNLQTSIYGDTVRDCATNPCAPPEGSPMNLIDKLAVVWAFASHPVAPRKARVDLEPAELDRLINISDILFSLRAFFGLPYPYEPSVADPCP